ncbi:hypothetical protein HYFRA_00010131 [Hymenoscyphus fraxineus]|uniref:Uncharacterized protein n=1 Tax=Hymenoscyphus fraxineus TaxID=746836 RepID=A0A9N9KT25_9HELO|nr:hypothetical protein HYFRA_00010131 [Hymenoscyphus fraxineus]
MNCTESSISKFSSAEEVEECPCGELNCRSSSVSSSSTASSASFYSSSSEEAPGREMDYTSSSASPTSSSSSFFFFSSDEEEGSQSGEPKSSPSSSEDKPDVLQIPGEFPHDIVITDISSDREDEHYAFTSDSESESGNSFHSIPGSFPNTSHLTGDEHLRALEDGIEGDPIDLPQNRRTLTVPMVDISSRATAVRRQTISEGTRRRRHGCMSGCFGCPACEKRETEDADVEDMDLEEGDVEEGS